MNTAQRVCILCKYSGKELFSKNCCTETTDVPCESTNLYSFVHNSQNKFLIN